MYHHLFWRGGWKPQLKYSSMKTHGHGMKMLLMVYLFLKKLPSLKKNPAINTPNRGQTVLAMDIKWEILLQIHISILEA